MTPLVSIIMAAYNEEHCIGKAIESIIGQTFTEWELVIINDGSSDATVDVVSRYAETDNRIRLVTNETNLRLPVSLNKGIKLAKADLIARADADDINLPERLARQYEHMQAHPEIDVLGGSIVLLDEQGNRCAKPLSLPQTHAELETLTFLKTHFHHPTVMIRKRFFTQAGMYSVSFPRAEDKELWLRGLRAGCRYANLADVLVEYSTDGYVRSWKSICEKTLSMWQMARVYRIKHGSSIVLAAFVHSIFVKLNIYRPKSLRGSGS